MALPSPWMFGRSVFPLDRKTGAEALPVPAAITRVIGHPHQQHIEEESSRKRELGFVCNHPPIGGLQAIVPREAASRTPALLAMFACQPIRPEERKG